MPWSRLKTTPGYKLGEVDHPANICCTYLRDGVGRHEEGAEDQEQRHRQDQPPANGGPSSPSAGVAAWHAGRRRDQQ